MKFHESITDSELLEQFTKGGSQAAFAVIVQRHGAMVRSVAMRTLGNHHDAEDITQAVFIKLSREAAKLAGSASVAGWLHTVSRRLSLNARESRESRQKRELAAMDQNTADIANEEVVLGFQRELDAALARLPERYRQPLVIFHLEGVPLHQAAERLQLHPVTLRTRLSRAREMLRGVLVQRGVGVASVAVLSSLFAAEAKAAVLPPALAAAIFKTAAGSGTAASPAVLELANTAVKFKSGGIFTLLITPLIIMKTKTTAIAAAALIIAALCIAIPFIKESENSRHTKSNLDQGSASSTERMGRSKVSEREKHDALSKMSTMDFYMLCNKVLLISDDTERLAAIREKLGMNISDEVYSDALAAFGYKSRSKTQQLLEQICSSWLENDPIAAMQWTSRLSEELSSRMIAGMLRLWMRKDPVAAMAWAEKNLDAEVLAVWRNEMANEERDNADKFLIADLAEKLLATPDNGKRNHEYSELKFRLRRGLSALAQDDPKAALDLFNALDPETKIDLYGMNQTLYEAFANKDPNAALASFMALEPEERSEMHGVMKDLYSKWAFKDPDAAFASAMTLNDKKDMSEALLGALPSWQVKHPEKSIDQAADLSVLNENQYNQLMGRLVEELAITNPTHAANYAMGMDDAKLKNEFIGITARAWVAKDAAGAERWANSLPKGESRDLAHIVLADYVFHFDSSHASQLINQIESLELRHQSIRNAINGYENKGDDLPNLIQLADQLPTIEERSITTLIGQISPDHIDRLEAWIKDQNAKGRIVYESDENPAKNYQNMLNEINKAKAKQK